MVDRYPPRIPLSVPDLRGRESEYLAQCVSDNWVSSAGPFVTEMERRVAQLAGRKAGIACVNGSAALQVALSASGIGPGDYVIVPDWTFAATVNAVIHAGAVPVFADIQATDWTIDPASVDAAITAHKGKVKAIIAVDVLGNMADPEPLQTLAQYHSLTLLEDAAGAIGASRDGLPAGGIGNAGIFSFNGNKLVTAGGGGMYVTDDEAMAARFRHLTTQARVGSDYRHDMAGFNYRMTNINAAVGLAQLERLDDMLALKVAIARRYEDAVFSRGDIAFMPVSRPEESSYWLSNIVVADEPSMRSLIEHLNTAGIDARPFWCSLSVQAPYKNYPAMPIPVSTAMTDRVVTLPCSSHLTAQQQDRV
ncbi:MAG: aminotransferase class I/II-fold pyridoxal phosphate-dependent enzyme, partial [Alphaproteobacteria bacterium]|nr:aminotransferase class I/II-fold pyridoxal phosphate-dependent enzyme [Alphaproteobacteria bacterium]